MLHKVLAFFGILGLMSCTPAYSTEELGLNAKQCSVVKSMARQIVIDLQQGATQYQIMRKLNNRPLDDFGPDGEMVKLYLQVNTSAFARNVRKGYRVSQIINAVDKDCATRVES